MRTKAARPARRLFGHSQANHKYGALAQLVARLNGIGTGIIRSYCILLIIGALAKLVSHLNGIQGATGSNPVRSTNPRELALSEDFSLSFVPYSSVDVYTEHIQKNVASKNFSKNFIGRYQCY